MHRMEPWQVREYLGSQGLSSHLMSREELAQLTGHFNSNGGHAYAHWREAGRALNAKVVRERGAGYSRRVDKGTPARDAHDSLSRIDPAKRDQFRALRDLVRSSRGHQRLIALEDLLELEPYHWNVAHYLFPRLPYSVNDVRVLAYFELIQQEAERPSSSTNPFGNTPKDWKHLTQVAQALLAWQGDGYKLQLVLDLLRHNVDASFAEIVAQEVTSAMPSPNRARVFEMMEEHGFGDRIPFIQRDGEGKPHGRRLAETLVARYGEVRKWDTPVRGGIPIADWIDYRRRELNLS